MLTARTLILIGVPGLASPIDIFSRSIEGLFYPRIK